MATIAGYELGRLLGKGSFGETFQARKGGQTFALKLIKEEAIQAGYDVKRFQREVRALQKVVSPHVVRIAEAGQDTVGQETKLYIVMEFLLGKDLFRYFEASKRNVAEQTLKSQLLQVINGLEDIHAQNIVHRDLKP